MKELCADDDIINEMAWKKFVTKLQDEWNGFVIGVGCGCAATTGSVLKPCDSQL